MTRSTFTVTMLHCLAMMFAVTNAHAIRILQTPNTGIARGDSVVIVVPTRYATVHHTGLGGVNTKFDITTRLSGTTVEVQDPDDSTWRSDWRLGGFPSAAHYYVSNVKRVTRLDDQGGPAGRFIEVTMKVAKGFDYRVYAPMDHPEVIRSLVAPVGVADSIMKIAYDSLGAHFFTGPLNQFSPEERHLLLTFAHITANGTRIGSETFKGVTYLTISLPADGNVWNDLRVTRTERIGRVISAQLALLKGFARIAVRHDLIGGLKLTQLSTHGTAPSYDDTRNDRIEAYFAVDVLVKFADADITSQQLVNQSIVLANGDRIEVDLSTQ